MAKRKREDKEFKTRDYVVYFIVAFVLIFLTSSFVIEDIYNSAESLSITPQGVQAVYESSIGERQFSKTQDDANQDTTTQTTPSTTVTNQQ
jgi:hypothetical protein